MLGVRLGQKLVVLLIALLVTLAFGACGRKRTRVPAPPAVRAGGEEVGIASWYGHPYHGRRTASGEVYDMEQLTAAHLTRPLQSWVRVINLHNAKAVEVRINDRGPFVDGRIVDLSKAAARQIDMIGPGTAWVRLESIAAPVAAPPPVSVVAAKNTPPPLVPPDEVLASTPPPVAVSTGQFTVQVGAFRVFENADRLRAEMEASHGVARVVVRGEQPGLFRVLVGEFATAAEAEAVAGAIRDQEMSAFVVRLDEPVTAPAAQ